MDYDELFKQYQEYCEDFVHQNKLMPLLGFKEWIERYGEVPQQDVPQTKETMGG